MKYVLFQKPPKESFLEVIASRWGVEYTNKLLTSWIYKKIGHQMLTHCPNSMRRHVRERHKIILNMSLETLKIMKHVWLKTTTTKNLEYTNNLTTKCWLNVQIHCRGIRHRKTQNDSKYDSRKPKISLDMCSFKQKLKKSWIFKQIDHQLLIQCPNSLRSHLS